MMVSAARVDTASTSTVYIGIGSNLGRPLEQVRRARDALGALPNTRLMGISPFYRNPAIGPGDQPDYVNAVAAIETRLGPHELLDALQVIEANQGRKRSAVRWQPRTVDLDLLVYGDRAIHDQRLTIPHPHIHERAFVLKPLLDLAPHLEVPGLGPVARLLSCVPDGLLRRVEDSGDTQ
jgi:2-amino-4-hydroxy-6-hydroxymethyldihydropteridine diphosphokinase